MPQELQVSKSCELTQNSPKLHLDGLQSQGKARDELVWSFHGVGEALELSSSCWESRRRMGAKAGGRESGGGRLRGEVEPVLPSLPSAFPPLSPHSPPRASCTPPSSSKSRPTSTSSPNLPNLDFYPPILTVLSSPSLLPSSLPPSG